MSLYKKHRPDRFDHVVGNVAAVKALGELLQKDPRPNTYLFHGPTGCGKTTLARIYAQELGASKDTIYEVNSANFRGIDTIRDMIEDTRYRSMDGKPKVWIIDEVHQMTKPAQEAALKMLEDSHPSCYFILATTEPTSLLPAIKSRCTTIAVSRLNDAELDELLTYIAKEEDYELSDELFDLILEKSEGRPREAIQMLEVSLPLSDREAKKAISAWVGEDSSSELIELCRLLANSKTHWSKITGVLRNLQVEPESARRMILAYFTKAALGNAPERPAYIIQCFSENFYDTGKAGLVLSCYVAMRKGAA